MRFLSIPSLVLLIWGSLCLSVHASDSLRVDSMLKKVKVLEKSDPLLAKETLLMLQNECLQSQATDPLYRIRIVLSNWESSHGSPDSSKRILSRLLEETASDTFYPMRGTVLHNLGRYHQDRGEYSRALPLYQQAITVFQATNQRKGLAAVYGKLAFIYKTQNQLDRAEEYYSLAQATFSDMGQWREYAAALHNFGFLYIAQESFVKADSLFSLTKQVAIREKMPDMVSLANFALAGVYIDQNRLIEAENALNGLKDDPYIQHVPDRKAGYLIRIGNVKIRQKQFALALAACEDAMALGKQIQSLEIKKSACRCLSQAHEELGNASKALQFWHEYYTYRDSLEMAETQALLAGIRAEYDLEKVERALAESNLEKERESNLRQVAEQNASQQRKLRLFFLVLLLLAVLFLGYYLFTNQKVRSKNQTIQRALAEKEVLLGEVHHRVKNNLQLISSIIDLQAKSTHHAPTEQLLGELRNRIHAITVLHTQLYQQPELHAVRTQDYLPPILEHLKQSLQPEGREIEFGYELDNFSLPVGTAISLGLIVSELVTNAFRHAFPVSIPLPSIHLTLKAEGDQYILQISDNGKGFAPANDNFGMRMIRSLVRQMKGQLIIESQSGTQFTLIWKEKTPQAS